MMAIRLEDFLFPDPKDSEDEQFKIDSPEKADWALRKYAQAKNGWQKSVSLIWTR